MQRKDVVKLCDEQVLDTASQLFGTRKGALTVFADYEGAANLVYAYEQNRQSFILRISFRSDRTREQIQAELDFVHYLAEGGVRVSRPVPSTNGSLIETIEAEGIPFHAVSFIKGKGIYGLF